MKYIEMPFKCAEQHYWDSESEFCRCGMYFRQFQDTGELSYFTTKHTYEGKVKKKSQPRKVKSEL